LILFRLQQIIHLTLLSGKYNFSHIAKGQYPVISGMQFTLFSKKEPARKPKAAQKNYSSMKKTRGIAPRLQYIDYILQNITTRAVSACPSGISSASLTGDLHRIIDHGRMS